jgi:hypothetical protein
MTKQAIAYVIVEIKPTTMLPGQVGLFASRSLPSGTIIAASADYEDTFLPWSEAEMLDEITRKRIFDFCVMNETGVWLPKHLNLNLISNVWYMNHSCAPNVAFNAEDDFVAIRNINAGEELLWDTGTGVSTPSFSMECHCGTPACRKVITGNDWRQPEFRNKMKGKFFSEIQKQIDSLAEGSFGSDL